MARRLPSAPPALPGFSHVHVLGSGGFADVFLYEQNMPRRQVAVKVMLSEVVNDQVRLMFQAEANLMAQLSSHPSILTVYQASVSSDGRPYLVMELCSSTLSQRYRVERLPVPEVLRIAIKIGSAIETAHRAGVLHRDIKPSNILTTAYGHPVLSDFGIAATLSESENLEAVGMSIPWSAPEVLMDETAGTIESELWSYAATVYSLLAGRSPFEVPGESNKSTDLISRINRAKPRTTGRSDVPESLERALNRAMSRKAEARQGSVLELVHELQAVESELGLSQTAIEVAMDDWALATVAELEDRTRVRPGQASPMTSSQRRKRRRPANIEESFGSFESEAAEGKMSRRKTGISPIPKTRGMQTVAWIGVALAAFVVVLGATATFIQLQSGSNDIPVVSDISASVSADVVEFSWLDPGLEAGDFYQIKTTDGQPSVQQREPNFVVDAESGENVCISVTVTREGKSGPASAQKCAVLP
ncbi:serine/threonine protein kinase [Salinibacterium amurskyense]|uniref:non-specific serine/threonine protein kinase n=1 Tax=Salinibacterium amurskyense TaxID=205941 RepID=A0A2M9D1M8_9MICO|nr:serine/threonine-protein kinase [Salinibacterium amurskyense]PJJ78079.1 serine/threonine protein kinase [Salinibacterium amurskyense]RLQ80231.1 serine/threonine protein kinase [Salinibacterium amurskyense]